MEIKFIKIDDQGDYWFKVFNGGPGVTYAGSGTVYYNMEKRKRADTSMESILSDASFFVDKGILKEGKYL